MHLEFQRNKKTIPFIIDFDSTNQPVLDDAVRSRRLKKRPDFACAMFDPQATDGKTSQIRYSLECKRLGNRQNQWVLNENYCELGQLRFVREDHGYAKGCPSAAMIGYVQDMEPDDILGDVNQFAIRKNLPSLRKASEAWVVKGVSTLEQDTVNRDFDQNPIVLRHLWVDLRHCEFEVPPPTPPSSVKKVPPKKAETKKSAKAAKKKAT